MLFLLIYTIANTNTLNTLVSADYAQIEMRVLAHFCNDKNMQALFRSSDTATNDIYLLMAASVFAKPLNQVTKTDRNRVKTVSLGIIYGIGVNQIMSRLDLQQSEAQHMKDLFFKLYPGVRRVMASVKENVRKSGYISSLLSYRRYLPDIHSTNTSARAKAERSAINSVIQGSASDILKMAMLQVDEEVRRWQQNEVTVRLPRLIMSIHDEVIYEVHASHQVQFVTALRHILEQRVPQAFNLKVPLTVTIAAGPSWGELQPIKDPATYEMCAPVKSGPSIVNRPSDGAASHAFDTAFEENTSANTSSNHNNKTLAHLRGSDYTSINAPKFKSTD